MQVPTSLTIVGRFNLSNEEKQAYIAAEKCLQSAPAAYGIPGARTIWDELQYVHIRQANFIHGVVSHVNPRMHSIDRLIRFRVPFYHGIATISSCTSRYCQSIAATVEETRKFATRRDCPTSFNVVIATGENPTMQTASGLRISGMQQTAWEATVKAPRGALPTAHSPA